MLVATTLYNGRSEYLYRIPSEELYNKILNNMEYPNNINENRSIMRYNNMECTNNNIKQDSSGTTHCGTTIWNVQIMSNKTVMVQYTDNDKY